MTSNPPYGPPPQLPHGGHARKSSPVKIILIVIGVVVALCAAGVIVMAVGVGGTAKVIETAEVDRLSHIKVDRCERTMIDTIEVDYRITNAGNVEATYLIEVKVTDDDGTQVGTATGFEDGIGPGVTATGTAVGTVTSPKSAKLTCTVTGA